MRLFLSAALLVASTATHAAAQTSFSSSPGAPDPGIGAQTMLLDFNGVEPFTGFSLSGSYSILNGSVSGAAAPAGVASRFFAVPNVGGASNGSAIIDFSSYLATNTLTGLSFYWGSIDTYNTLDILGEGNVVLASITGSQVVNPANGNQVISETNRRLYVEFGSDAADFRALRVNSNGRAFEIDDIAGTIAAPVSVPEPTTLAVLTLGLGMLGAAGARRRRGDGTTA